MSDNKTNWYIILVVTIVVAVISSLLTANIVGNVIKVSQVASGTSIYTQAEVDVKINSLTSQISALTTRINVCCPVTNPINQTGSLSVASVPSSASLYIDSSYKGLTPLTISSLSVGNHNVKVVKSGYNTYTTTKYIYAGSNSLNITLIPVTNPINQTGSLSVTSSPSSAKLYVGNSYRGLTPLTVSSLSVGNYAVLITKTGYNNYSTTKYVYSGSNSLNITLIPATNQTNQTG